MLNCAGFTLVEWIVAMALVSLLVGSIAPGFLARLSHARVRAAQREVISIGTSLDRFYRDVGGWPTRD